MEFADYLQGVQRLLWGQIPEEGRAEDAALSLPVAVERSGGGLADAFFAYGEGPGRGRPFAWAKLDGATGAPLLYARCEVLDFALPDAPPPGASLSLTPPQSAPEMAGEEARAELWELYRQLRPFALAAHPAPEQQDVMRRYARLFERLVWQEHRSFYRALAGPFLDWLGLDPIEWLRPESLPSPECDLTAAVEELSRLFVRKIETDRHKDALFDRMHAELQEYKNDLLDTLTRSMEGDIIKLIDDIEKTMERYHSLPFTRDNYRRLLALFEGVETDLTDLLYRHGLEPFSQEGEEVAVGRQKILATLPTEQESLDKKVAARHARGWEKNEKVVRPERISAYRFAPPKPGNPGKQG